MIELLERLKHTLKGLIKYLIFNFLDPAFLIDIRARYWARKLPMIAYESPNMHFLKRFLSEGVLCVDVGANIGQYSYNLSKMVGINGRIFAFEPVTYTFELLRKILASLNIENVDVYNLGLGERSEKKLINIVKDFLGVPNIGLSHLGNTDSSKNYGTELVKIESLDDFNASVLKLESCAFIKIDVEGSELQVLKGGKTF